MCATERGKERNGQKEKKTKTERLVRERDSLVVSDRQVERQTEKVKDVQKDADSSRWKDRYT